MLTPPPSAAPSHLLRVDVDIGQPASKAWVRVVPSDDHFWPSRLLQHVQHLGLKHVVDGFDRDRRAGLRHREDVHALFTSLGQAKFPPFGCDGLTEIVVASINSPNINPMTSSGTPARPCFSIFNNANDEIWIVSPLSSGRSAEKGSEVTLPMIECRDHGLLQEKRESGEPESAKAVSDTPFMVPSR